MRTITFTYLDHSNLIVEGQRVSAVQKEMALDIWDATERGIFDFAWRPDYHKLRQLICGQRGEIGWVKLWGSSPPGGVFWTMLGKMGFAVKIFDRSHGKEKKVDVAIAFEMALDSQKIPKDRAEIILVAGDKDYVPAVEGLVSEGFNVTVAFWNHAASELKQAASSFFSLNRWFKHLSLRPLPPRPP